MKTIKTTKGNYLFVEVPDDGYDYRYKIMPDNTKQLVSTVKDEYGNVGTCYIIENPIGEIISTTKDITEEECKNLIEMASYYNSYWNYITNDNHKSNQLGTAKESLYSLMGYHNLNTEKNFLIIKKDGN